MTDEDKASWDRVASEFQALGLKLKLHVEQASSEGDREQVNGAVQQVVERLEEVFSGLGNAVRDDAVRDDAKRAATSLAQAVSSSLEQVGARLRGGSSQQ